MVELDTVGLKHWQDNSLEYVRYIYPLTPESLIVDLGAYDGDFSSRLNSIYGCENFISWEPTEAIYKIKFGKKIKACAWIKDDTLRSNGAFYYTSIIHNDEPGLNNLVAYDVARNFPDYVDLLKINIEGAEYELLKYMIAQDLLKRCRYIQIQFHVTDKFNCRLLYEEIYRQMAMTHNVHWVTPFLVVPVWQSWKIKNELC